MLSNFCFAGTSKLGSRIHFEFGVKVGNIKHDIKRICENKGLLKWGYKPDLNGDIIINGKKYSQHNGGNEFAHSCDYSDFDCTKILSYKTNFAAGTESGMYLDLYQNFAIGIEGLLHWFRVNIKRADDVYQCTKSDCEIKNIPAGYPPTEKNDNFFSGVSGLGGLACNKRFPSNRYYVATDVVKYYNKLVYGAMLAIKIYPANRDIFLKIAGGICKIAWKGPIHNEEIDSTHESIRKRIYTKNGFIGKVSLNKKISRNISLGVEYEFVSCKNTSQVLTFQNQGLALALLATFGE